MFDDLFPPVTIAHLLCIFFVVLWRQFLIYRVLPQAFSSGKCGERICNAQDCDGETPLHIAARKGCLPVVKLFFQIGVVPNIKNKKNLSPIHLAAENGHPQ